MFGFKYVCAINIIGYCSVTADRGCLRATFQYVFFDRSCQYASLSAFCVNYAIFSKTRNSYGWSSLHRLHPSISDAENPTGFGIAAGVNSHIDGSRVSTTSLYPVGSATKLYTSVAVLQAHEQGLIDLDAPVAPVIDPFLMRTNGTTLFQLWQNEAINQVTARQLLSMRSGLSDYDDAALNKFSLDPANWNEDITPYDYLHRWAVKKFLFEPGTGGSYTSIGYEVLGFLLAAAHNVTSWQAFDQKSIFPAELRSKLPNMIFSGTGKCSANHQIVHQYAAVIQPLSTWTAIHFIDIDDGSCLNAWTAGSLATSASDMAGALYNIFGLHPVSPLLSNSSLEQMVHVQPLTTGWSVGLEYGLGCMAADLSPNSGFDKKYTEIIGHAGQDYGSGAPLHYYNRALDLTITLALNSQFGMNCSLNDISENQRYTAIICQVYSELLTIATNGTVGPLKCSKLQEEKSSTRAEISLGHSRRRLLGGDLHCSSAKNEKLCYGSSANVATSECFTWKSFHAQFNGEHWKKCHDKWDDPCGCELVTCSGDGQHILELHLSDNSLYGIFNVTDLSGLSSLRHLDLSANALYGALIDVTAQLPSLVHLNVSHNFFSFYMPYLNFKQLSGGCSLRGNDFACPLVQLEQGLGSSLSECMRNNLGQGSRMVVYSARMVI